VIAGRWYAVLVGAFFLHSIGATQASPQVVGDEACLYHAVDVASFATCEDGKVVRPAMDSAGVAAPPPREPRARLAWLPAAEPRSSDLVQWLLAANGDMRETATPAHGRSSDCASPAMATAQLP
jgi:hypothetical protein